jgi:hypothetical protein
MKVFYATILYLLLANLSFVVSINNIESQNLAEDEGMNIIKGGENVHVSISRMIIV